MQYKVENLKTLKTINIKYTAGVKQKKKFDCQESQYKMLQALVFCPINGLQNCSRVMQFLSLNFLRQIQTI